MAADSEGFFALTGLAAIEFAGEHSEQFLQGQLTADVAGLTAGKWQWAGYCTPQGKMLCTALIWRCGEDSIGLVIADDLVADICRRLQMYILRAKTAVQPMQASISGRLGGQPAANEVLTLAGGGWLLGLVDGLQLRVGDAAAADADCERQWWRRWLSAGAPLIGAAVADKFTPQMASLDLIGGVSFSKGCYVGQEIVARTHHLGKVKRRAYLVEGSGTPPDAGSDLLIVDQGDQAVGAVIRASATEDGFIALTSLRIDAAAAKLKLADERSVTAKAPAYGIGD